jgi:ketosteroid isomerase-like protein
MSPLVKRELWVQMMKNLSLTKFLALIIVSCSLTAALGCHKETDEDKIKKVIADVQEAVKEKDVKKIVNNVSKAYKDPQGYDHDTIKGLLLGYFFRHGKIHVYIPEVAVTVDGASGKAVFQAVLTGRDRTGSNAGVLPESFGIYSFEVSFQMEDGAWKVTSALWHRVSENSPK